MKSILLIDDDHVFRERLAKGFSRRGFECFEAESLQAARGHLHEHQPDYAVLDLNLNDGFGLDLLADFKEHAPDTRVTVLTGFGSIATTVTALKEGAVHYLTKPVSIHEILAALGIESAAEVPTSSPNPTLEEVEWSYINRVMNECDGNITKASKMLGMHRRSLQRKLSKQP